MARTPGLYTDINTQTQRTGLPTQNHSIVLVTSDVGAPTTPMPVYDTASADTISGADSNAGRMMAAALSVSQGVRVDTVGKSEGGDGSGGESGFNPVVCTPSSADFAVDYQPDFAGVTTVHGRYRVNNGSWVDYVDNNVDVSTPSAVISKFLDSISGANNEKLIAKSYSPEGAPTPFYCPKGEYAIYSGAAAESPLVSYAQKSFDSALATKIDFEVTGSRPSDLVAVMFAGNKTVMSCALAYWNFV